MYRKYETKQGRNIRVLCEAFDVEWKTLADAIHVDFDFMKGWFKNKKSVSLEHVQRVADYFDVSYSTIQHYSLDIKNVQESYAIKKFIKEVGINNTVVANRIENAEGIEATISDISNVLIMKSGDRSDLIRKTIIKLYDIDVSKYFPNKAKKIELEKVKRVEDKQLEPKHDEVCAKPKKLSIKSIIRACIYICSTLDSENKDQVVEAIKLLRDVETNQLLRGIEND